MVKMVDRGLLRKENMNLVLVGNSIEALLEKMQVFEPMPVPKWMNKNQT
jgi:hypothetical protein